MRPWKVCYNFFQRAEISSASCFFFIYFLCFSSFPPFACHAYLFLDISFFSACNNMFSFLCSLCSAFFSLPILSFICLPCVWLTSLLFRALASSYERSINLHRQACLIWVSQLSTVSSAASCSVPFALCSLFSRLYALFSCSALDWLFLITFLVFVSVSDTCFR